MNSAGKSNFEGEGGMTQASHPSIWELEDPSTTAPPTAEVSQLRTGGSQNRSLDLKVAMRSKEKRGPSGAKWTQKVLAGMGEGAAWFFPTGYMPASVA